MISEIKATTKMETMMQRFSVLKIQVIIKLLFIFLVSKIVFLFIILKLFSIVKGIG